MSAWDDLVTAALLGAGRARPGDLPAQVARLAGDPDPGRALLDVAAGYATYRHAGARPARRLAPAPAPRQQLDPAPQQAQELLADLLRAGDTPGVQEWLARCVAQGQGVRPGLWVPLVTAAVRPRGPDRSLVRAALGRRGVAFAQQNPAWRVLARAADLPGHSGSDPDPGSDPVPGPEETP